jgi:hypothetical protein
MLSQERHELIAPHALLLAVAQIFDFHPVAAERIFADDDCVARSRSVGGAELLAQRPITESEIGGYA